MGNGREHRRPVLSKKDQKARRKGSFLLVMKILKMIGMMLGSLKMIGMMVAV
jgi:hypothetical protein